MLSRRPSVFIGSSSEGLTFAKATQQLLDSVCEVTIWSQGVFGLGYSTLETLIGTVGQYDFALLILTADDLIHSRNLTAHAPRDNVLFELGLFMGGLGRDRTFVMYDRAADIKLPSDLAGISMATFEMHSSGNVRSSLGAAVSAIEERINQLGRRDGNNQVCAQAVVRPDKSDLTQLKNLSVQPAKTFFENETVSIEHLRPEGKQMLSSTRFSNCVIKGPGAVVLTNGSYIRNRFLECGEIIVLPSGVTLTGILVLHDCTFQDCDLFRITIFTNKLTGLEFHRTGAAVVCTVAPSEI